MGLINIYDGLNNEHKEINENGYLKNLLPGYNLENCIILKAGETIGGDYEVKSDDVLYLRVTPRALSTAALATIAIVTGVVTLAGAAVGGILLYNQTKKTQEEMEKAQRDANNLAQQINTKPFLKGAKNKSALGSLIPYQFGRVYNTPYMLSDGFIKIAGTRGANEFYNFNLNLGYGDLVVEKVLIGDEVILEDADGIADGVHNFNSSSPYYDAGNFLELRQAGETFTSENFNNKVVLTNCGDELKHDHDDAAGTEIIKQVADYTKKLEVCIQFNGLRIYDTNTSTWKARKATVKPYWSNDGGANWHEFYFTGMSNNSIEINTQDTIRFVATKEFAPGEVMAANAAGEIEYKEILLKVVKTTPKAESNSNEDAYLLYHQSYCYDPKKSSLTSLVNCAAIEEELTNKLTRLAVRIKAAENTDGLLDDLHVVASAKAATWDGDAWSNTKSATSNPAAVIYEILTSDKHKASQLTTDEFDAEELGALYEYCETQNYTVNAIITTATKKIDILDKVLNACNATMYRQDGVIHFAIDKLEPLPVALINAENIKNISYSKELKRKPNGVKVTYTNSKNWAVDTFYSMLDGRDYKTENDTVTELALDYVTDYKHAYKLANRYLKQLILQPRTITAGVGKAGDRYPLYSVVLLQYKEFRQGLRSTTIDGLIKNSAGDIIGINVSDIIKLHTSPNYKYGVVIQAVTDQGSALIYKSVTFDLDLVALGTTRGKLRTSSGLLGVKKPTTIKTRKFYFREPITSGIKPELFNIVSIGLLDENGQFDTVTNKMKITGIDPDGNNGFTLTLKDYNPSIYTVGAIPPYKSNLTPPTRDYKKVPSNTNAINTVAAAEAKAEIYQETGLNKLDSVEITETNTATGETTIKADLIKGARGVFDDITANRGTYNEITANKAKLENTLYRLSNVINIDVLNTNTNDEILNKFETVRNNLFTKYGELQGAFACFGSYIITFKQKSPAANFYYRGALSSFSLRVNSYRLLIVTGGLFFDMDRNIVRSGSITIEYNKNTNLWKIDAGNIGIEIPSGAADFDNYEFNINLIF